MNGDEQINEKVDEAAKARFHFQNIFWKQQHASL
jgi:hypothetical protein